MPLSRRALLAAPAAALARGSRLRIGVMDGVALAPSDPESVAAAARTGAEGIQITLGRLTTAGRTVRVRGKVAPAGAERRVVVRIGARKLKATAGRDGRQARRLEIGATELLTRVRAATAAAAKGASAAGVELIRR